jgi:hypothetical protein
MWSQIFDVGTFRSRFDDVPDGFRCQAFASDLFLSAYSPKDCTLIYLSCVDPLIDRALRPHRDWNCANVLSLSNQVGDHPVLLADLKIFHSESYQFGASQATPNEQGENRSITFASEAIQRLCEQSPRLINGQPVSDPNAQTFWAFHSTDSGCQFGTQKACISCLVCDSSHSR